MRLDHGYEQIEVRKDQDLEDGPVGAEEGQKDVEDPLREVRQMGQHDNASKLSVLIFQQNAILFLQQFLF